MANPHGKIFIGHGHSPAWRDLKDFLVERLHLDYDEFNREVPAGLTTKERLEQMLNDAVFAFLIMTAEDEHSDATKHARENVIHEVGLFQGRLGFRKAIVFLEEGCTEFSNIIGLSQIRFPRGSISASFEQIRRVLEREAILNPAQPPQFREQSRAERQSFEPEMIRIPAGTFLMGSDSGKDQRAFDDEQPQHTLCLPEYYLAKTPVTNAQYAAFVHATRHNVPKSWTQGGPPPGKENHPVVQISWYDALAYCRWLTEVTGRRYGLPSEAEWEKGARGSDGRIHPWGDQWEAARCNSDENGLKGTTPVGTYLQGASPYGLQDMAGNAWDWTCSLWGEGRDKPDFRYPYNPYDGRENLETSEAMFRVLRGGGFKSVTKFVRCAYRLRNRPNDQYEDFGFRVVMHP